MRSREQHLRSWAGPALALACLVSATHADEPPKRARLDLLDPAVRIGVRVSVKGTLQPDRTLRAQEIELQSSDDRDEELQGPITNLDPQQETFTLVGRTVRVRWKTELVLEPDRLVGFEDLHEGLRVKVDGVTDENGRLKADKVRIYENQTPRETVKIEGPIQRLDSASSGVTLEVAGVSVRLTRGTELIGRRGESRSLLRRLGGAADDEELLFTRNRRLGRHVAFAGEVRLRAESVSNLDLDDATDDDELVPQITGRIGFVARLGPAYGYITFIGAQEFLLRGGESFESGTSTARVGEAYVQFPVATGVSMAVGRQRINDEREWLYNTRSLDAVRFFATHAMLQFEASISRDLFDVGSNVRDQELRTAVLQATYRVMRDVDLVGYLVDRSDLEPLDDSPRTFGVRAIGGPGRHVDFWADLAYQTGTACSQVKLSEAGAMFDSGRRCNRSEQQGEFNVREVRAYALDAGVTYRPRVALDPSFTLGYAHGSGEDDAFREESVEEAAGRTATGFRQTGLHRNRWSFNGVVAFRYYGEVMDPELFNLRILTAGVGLRPVRSTSIDVLYHQYRQDKASKSFHEFEVDDTPSGLDPDIGSEIDVVFGYEPSSSFELRLTGGWFRPGKALDADATPASVVRFQARFRF